MSDAADSFDLPESFELLTSDKFETDFVRTRTRSYYSPTDAEIICDDVSLAFAAWNGRSTAEQEPFSDKHECRFEAGWSANHPILDTAHATVLRVEEGSPEVEQYGLPGPGSALVLHFVVSELPS